MINNVSSQPAQSTSRPGPLPTGYTDPSQVREVTQAIHNKVFGAPGPQLGGQAFTALEYALQHPQPGDNADPADRFRATFNNFSGPDGEKKGLEFLNQNKVPAGFRTQQEGVDRFVGAQRDPQKADALFLKLEGPAQP